MAIQRNYKGWALKVPISLSLLYSLYPSMGDVSISTATTWSTTLDGPIQVFRVGSLTVNDALTFQYRNRGVLLLPDKITMGTAASISMTGRGAVGSARLSNQDIVFPSYITLYGRDTSPRTFFKWLRKTGYCILDPNMFASPPSGMGDVTADYTSWPSRVIGSAIITASGVGAGGEPKHATGDSASAYSVGNPGIAGTHAPGGGAGGSACCLNSTDSGASGRGGQGCVWGGGPAGGSEGGPICSHDADQYGGFAGDTLASDAQFNVSGSAGNPGTSGKNLGSAGLSGTGGVLLTFCKGDINIATAAGHKFFAADGIAGTDCGVSGAYYNVAGSGSGAGKVGIYYGGTLTGTLDATSISVTGGLGGVASGGTYANVSGAKGGDGAFDVQTFAAMGWS